MNRATIGFDRRIELSWLDEAAACAARGERRATARSSLEALLGPDAGAPGSSARSNTIGVLIRLWVWVGEPRRGHRDRGLNLLSRLPPEQHVWIHWGAALAAYPFFYDTATHLGRQLSLQGSVSLASLTRRMAESWGDRTTMARALQRVVRSMVSWGALRETEERGTFAAPEVRSLPPAEVGAWLLEAALRGSGAEALTLRHGNGQACLFPFKVELSSRELRDQPGVELHREGGERDVVVLR